MFNVNNISIVNFEQVNGGWVEMIATQSTE